MEGIRFLFVVPHSLINVLRRGRLTFYENVSTSSNNFYINYVFFFSR